MEQTGTNAKITIIFPEKLWLGEISRKFPYFGIEIRSFIPISQEPFIGNSLIAITGSNPAQILIYIKDHPSLHAYFVLEESPTHLVLNTQTKDQFLLKNIVKNFILVRFPVKVEGGKADLNISSASRQNIDKFIEELIEHGIDVELKSISQFTDQHMETDLTPRQLYIYQRAKELGYYDTPRRITLSELAEKEKMSKSTLSALLQRIHKKLLGSN